MSKILTGFKSKELFYQGSILLVLVIFNYRVLNTWFIVDDTADIFCSSFNTIKLLFDRGTYLFFNQLFFTPLLVISYKLPWLLFKLNPIGYHLLNLLVAYLCCIVFYKFLKIYMAPLFSWLGGLLLSFSLPVSFDIGWVTQTHYLSGFLFSLIAVYLFKKWEDNRKTFLIFLSLLSTLTAFLFKEAYAFLPAAVFVVSSGSIIDRLRKSSPYIAIFAVYFLWRMYMLGSIGGYPGFTHNSIATWLFVPSDLLNNLVFPYFSFVFVSLLILTALFRFRMAAGLILMGYIVCAPLIFSPSSGFLLAIRALPFVAVISFGLCYIMNEVSLRNKKLIAVMILLLFIPISFGSIVKSRTAQGVIIRLSDNYEKAYSEIIKNKSEKILIVANNSYYFSNLQDIYRKMLKTDFPYIKAISTIEALPYLEIKDFDKIVVLNNLDLDPDVVSLSSMEVFTGLEAKQYITKNMGGLINERLDAPEVRFTNSKNNLKIDIIDSRDGTYLRCLYMGSYVGCYPIPKKYVYKYNSVKEIEKIVIIYFSHEGLMSKPATFIF